MSRKSKQHKNTFRNQEKKSGKSKKQTTAKTTKTNSGKRFKVPKPGERAKKIAGLTLLLLAFFMLFAFVSHLLVWKGDFSHMELSAGDFFGDHSIKTQNIIGKTGAYLAHVFITRWFGISAFLFILMFATTGLRWFAEVKLFPEGKLYRHSVFLILWISAALGFLFRSNEALLLGGSFGYHARQWLSSMFGEVGTGFLLVFILLVYLLVSFRFILQLLKKREKESAEPDNETAVNQHSEASYDSDEATSEDSPLPETEQAESSSPTPQDKTSEAHQNTNATPDDDQRTEYELSHENTAPDEHAEQEEGEDIEMTIERPEETENGSQEKEQTEKEHYTIDTPYDPTLELRDFRFPNTEQLELHGSDMISVEKEELETNKNKILKTLNNYNIEISKIKATIGPTITLYEIVPAPGVRISKIKNLEDDIALSLSALGIRIIAPIPGRGTIGIEVPNSNPETVSMKTVIQSSRFQNSHAALPVAIGKTISNETFVFDLAKMPHLLMAGATGQGKSVGLNAIITSLLYKKHPSQLKFVMVDPKKVELSLFSKIERHYLAKLPDSEEAIITDTQKVVKTLNSLTVEMDQRYELLKNAHVRNIKEYNTKFVDRKLNPEEGHRYLPYIVLIVDEFADLIMTAGKEVENPIARLAQLARAVGIHLIIATQRPSVNIITGVIKANFPARIAFRVTSKVDSRTILDASGADQLIGRGDMLLSTGNDLIRLQCAFVDTPEVDSICDFIGAQRAYPSAFILPEVSDDSGSGTNDISDEDRDELFNEAARVIVQHQHGSTSLLQRKLKLGYNRAGRIIDQLEAAGIVGPFEGSKAREVKIPDETTLEQYLNSET